MVITIKSSHGPIQSSKNSKGKQKQKEKEKEEQEVNPEIPLGKYLASTEKPIRDKAVKSLAAFLATGAAQNQQDGKGLLDEKEMDKLWKGIFYCFWMSDKPLVQQALASELSELILSIPKSDQSSSSSSDVPQSESESQPVPSSSKKSSKRRKSEAEGQEKEASSSNSHQHVGASNRGKIGLAFINGFWKAMIREWSGLDKYRLDKFYLLMRRLLNASFRFLASEDWNPDSVKAFSQNLINGGLNPFNHQLPASITYHISDIYLEELEKSLQISNEDSSCKEPSTSISTSQTSQRPSLPLLDLLSPFINLISSTNSKVVYERVWNNVVEKFWKDVQLIEEELMRFEERRTGSSSWIKKDGERDQEDSKGKNKKRKGDQGQVIDENGNGNGNGSGNGNQSQIRDGMRETMDFIQHSSSDYPHVFSALTCIHQEGDVKPSSRLRKFKKDLLRELFVMASRKESNESRRRSIYQFWRENGGDDDDDDDDSDGQES